MTRKKKEEHWSFAALRERLSEKTQIIIPSADDYPEGEPKVLRVTKTPDWEWGTIFLFDPELKREINYFFYDVLYPQILAVFENEILQVPAIDKIKLDENRSRSASCNALFIVTDPNRPVMSNQRPWWYIRFNLDVRAGYEYFLHAELILSIPFWLDSDWVFDYLIDARDWGIPPSLSTDRDELTLSFSWGKGTFYSFSSGEQANLFAEPFRKHLQIAKAVDRFSENTENRFLKSYMLQAIREFYGNL